jgi:TonB family protein
MKKPFSSRCTPQHKRSASLVASAVVHVVVVTIVIAACGPDIEVNPWPAHRSVSLVVPYKRTLVVRKKELRTHPLTGKQRVVPQLGNARSIVQLTAIPEAPDLAPMLPTNAPNLIIAEHERPPQPAAQPKQPVSSNPAIPFAAAVNRPAPIPDRSAATVSGFDAAWSGNRPNTRAATTEVGGSNGPTIEPAQLRTARQSIAGFPAATSAKQPQTRTVYQAANFGEVRTTDGRTESSVAAPRASADTPVRITGKSKPAYTEEAKRLRIEGAVVLEVTFSASGTVHNIRVVRGLGYGLDEAAVQAARSLVFEPAKRDGHPIDVTSNVRIEFQLTL